MANYSKPSNFKWTKEKCHEEALKYEHRIDFKKNTRGAYHSARINKWLDDICSHMTPLGNKYKRLIYRYIFPDNYCYVGLTHNPIKRKKAHLAINSAVYNHMIESGLEPKYEELTDYLDLEEAKQSEEFWKIKSEEEGFIILNKAKTGALGSDFVIWSKEKCKEDASKYKTRNDFRKNSVRAYMATFKNGWADEVCSHMSYIYKKWDKEKCREEALKYNTRYEYFLGSCSSYDNARRNGWLDEICSHMLEIRKPKNYWTIDRCREEASKYKTRGELRKNCSRAHNILQKNKLLDEIYPKNN